MSNSTFRDPAKHFLRWRRAREQASPRVFDWIESISIAARQRDDFMTAVYQDLSKGRAAWRKLQRQQGLYAR